MKINLTWIYNLLSLILILFSFELLENSTLFNTTKATVLIYLGFTSVLTTISLIYMVRVLRNYKLRQKAKFESDTSSRTLKIINFIIDVSIVVALYKGAYHQDLKLVEGLMVYRILSSQFFQYLRTKAVSKK